MMTGKGANDKVSGGEGSSVRVAQTTAPPLKRPTAGVPSPAVDPWLVRSFGSDYLQADVFDPRPVIDRFGASLLANHFDLEEETVDGERVVTIQHESQAVLPTLPRPRIAEQVIASRLELVRGIGPVTDKRLKAQGVGSIVDLAPLWRRTQSSKTHVTRRPRESAIVADPRRAGLVRFADDAAEVLSVIEERDFGRLIGLLTGRMAGRGHVLSALVVALAGIENVVFFDLETLGLANSVIFLAGIGRFHGKRFTVTQRMALGAAGERAVLESSLEALAGADVVVTYNGRIADMHWLVGRCFYNDLIPPGDVAHVDLVYGTRRRFVKDEAVLSDAKLTTVQIQLLGEERPDLDVPSWYIPRLFTIASTHGMEGLMVPVIEHNCSDIEALVSLVEVLCGEAVNYP